ncbi:CDP-glycerol glycerophosphotransferase family protein [Arthrobacter sp. 179]|uniref:CDP-glycerol glycerophosphotransferase family protein n=1 Tax=Arthrobacter sp. 179 TaxID=3457734 RepID=UPI0040348DDE
MRRKAKRQASSAGALIQYLNVRPVPGTTGKFAVSLTVAPYLNLSGLWCRIDGEWFELAQFVDRSAKSFDDAPETKSYETVIDLASVHNNVLPLTRVVQQETNSQTDEPGIRFRLYADVSAPPGKVPKNAASVQRTENGLYYRYPLGRAGETDFILAPQVLFGEDRFTLYVNRYGFLSVLVNEDLPDYALIRNDRLEVKSGVLRIKGKIFTRNAELTGAALLLLGRTSGFRGRAPLDFTFDEVNTRLRFGLRRYFFTATYDFSDDLLEGLIVDDTVDIYLELSSSTSKEGFRRRVGKSRYLVRRHSSGDSVSGAGKTLSVTPYYTFKAKNPSLYLELFDEQVFRYLQQSLRRQIVRKKAGPSKPVWVIGELPYKAQDNGLHFFRFMREFHPEIDAYYVIRRDSPERRNLEGYDHILDYRSKEHIDKVLEADRIVGTHDPGFLYPIRTPEFERRVKADKIFLQHGVTGAKWMVPNYGKQVSDFQTDLILVCSEREKEFFVRDFGYAPREVAVTGFTRFDALFAGDVVRNENQILIMPTWRPWLQDPDYFTDSEYYQRWLELLNSQELDDLKRRDGASIVFCLHPNMQQFSRYFAGDDVRVVIQGEVDVQRLMKESSAMVTDYSSVAFDFAFLDRPVVYYQFDADRFPAPHADPTTELPGPVVADQAGVLQALSSMIDRSCRMQDLYHERASRFLTHRKGSNNERTFVAISQFKTHNSSLRNALSSEFVKAVTLAGRRQKQYLPIMKQLYKLFRLLPLDPNVIVFESGQGRQFGDSPRAIYEELVRRGDTRKKVWIYNKMLPMRDDYTVVHKRHSPGFFWNLARAKFWVNNHNFPHYIHRRKHGMYIQTWHGTPLKRMFMDQDNFYGRDEGYKTRVATASAQWNALLSPSAYATKAMQSAYQYKGPVYELGYPRNDVLVGERGETVRQSVRQRLGIPTETKVILYAPTFRDDQPTKSGRFAFDWPFNPLHFHERFGPDTILLVRTHVLVNSKLVIPDEAKASVMDVSGYPDIQELFLASDMLVTDYSSSFFDYSILGRPMVFYAYDLENYRDNLRGFYLDYQTELPGPIVQDEVELFDAIEAASIMTLEQQAKIRSFAARFAPRDDGRAAARTVDELL